MAEAERPPPPDPAKDDIRPRPPMPMEWMRAETEWGVHVKPGPAGLRLGDLNTGSYGELPETWPDGTMRPRGAQPFPGAPQMGYAVFAKHEVWADNVADLYEEAIQRGWKPATDIDWAAIPAGPVELERARAQVLTGLAEQAWIQSVTYGAWLPNLSYGFHEVKLFLSTVVFGLARHTEAFRKRAMLHGGGLGRQGPAALNRAIIDARNFTEMILVNQLLTDSFTEVLLGRLARIATHPADARLYLLARQDRIRALAYGQARVRDALAARPEREPELHGYLQHGEVAITQDLGDQVSAEALAIVLGGDIDAIDLGIERLADLRRAQAHAYLARLAAAGLDRSQRQWPHFAVASGQITREDMQRQREQARERRRTDQTRTRPAAETPDA